MVTPTREDYMRALYDLERSHGKEIRSKDLQEKLALGKSTISERLRDLQDEGLVQVEKYGPVRLTAKGRRLGKKLTYKHRLIETFLNESLGLEPKEVHKEAHQLEHAFSDRVIKRLDTFLGYPEEDPHGSPIER